MSNINKLNKLVKGSSEQWLDEMRQEVENQDWLLRSAKIASRVLLAIKSEKGMTQKKLAEKMGVSPQYINKIVKGKENLTLENICKLEKALGIPLMSTPTLSSKTISSSIKVYKTTAGENTKLIKMKKNTVSAKHDQFSSSTVDNDAA